MEETVSSSYDANSQQLWLPSSGPAENQTTQHCSMVGTGAHEPPPLTEKLALYEGVSVFFKGVTPIK